MPFALLHHYRTWGRPSFDRELTEICSRFTGPAQPSRNRACNPVEGDNQVTTTPGAGRGINTDWHSTFRTTHSHAHVLRARSPRLTRTPAAAAHTTGTTAARSLRPHHTRPHGSRACTLPCTATPQHYLATLAAAPGAAAVVAPGSLRQRGRCMRQAACRDLRAEQRAESSDSSRGTRHQAGRTGAAALNAVRTAQLDRPGASACPSRSLARTHWHPGVPRAAPEARSALANRGARVHAGAAGGGCTRSVRGERAWRGRLLLLDLVQ